MPKPPVVPLVQGGQFWSRNAIESIMTTPTPSALPPFSKGEFLATVGCACSSRFGGTLVTPNDGATRSDREGGTQGLQ